MQIIIIIITTPIRGQLSHTQRAIAIYGAPQAESNQTDSNVLTPPMLCVMLRPAARPPAIDVDADAESADETAEICDKFIAELLFASPTLLAKFWKRFMLPKSVVWPWWWCWCCGW